MSEKYLKLRKLDSQERQIVRCLIKNPRLSDNAIGRLTDIPIRTVNRKRKELEEEGLLSYYTYLNIGPDGLKEFGARHLYLIKFKLGITQDQIIKEIKEEPNVRTVFTDLIYESHIAEIDGHTALIMIIEGQTDDDINNGFNGKILPSLEKNHGKGCVEQVSTIRLSKPIRIFHNYLPMVNMEKGFIKRNWADDAIFVIP
ncbi:Lrp/AsnC family transcriptional regulator [Candidatus Hecatella orcuttiae]|jgi:DNA-binding Lrp family transcriptional regulator|uniref:Lrp/AsnC family transcriptional regulator n=1 Tax=Candidatus Hecatella orcuttiae TaxID=1935119 RepID=UPI0028682CF5|nr:Lrp/AsnC family transcriptional regulator [Candidatus Hecatella orcuttiae]